MTELIQLIPPWFIIALVIFGVTLGTVAYLILLERKVASWTQDRLGPNRVGPAGLFQPLADGLKMFVKEDYRPKGADSKLFSAAPIIMMAVIILSGAVIPWGGVVQGQKNVLLPASGDVNAIVQKAVPIGAEVVEVKTCDVSPGLDVSGQPVPARREARVTYRWNFQIANINIGVLFVLAVLSLAVYGVVIGGWASNNKYSFLGGLRATAQMVSYEIPLGLSVLTVVLMFGTLDLAQIVDKQVHYWAGWIPAWNVFCNPLAFLMFLICIHAEANRAPFDLAEAEQELVGGYHTEYSSMRLGLLLLGEYAGMITTSAVCTALFFGGWHLPWIDKLWPALSGIDPASPSVTSSLLVCLVRSGVFFGKTIFVIFIFMWVRWSLPRFRFDQLMQLAWRGMIPIALGTLLATGLVVYGMGAHRYIAPEALDRSRLADYQMRIGGTMALWMLAANVAVIAITMVISTLLPPAKQTNRRIAVPGSRFTNTPLPATTT